MSIVERGTDASPGNHRARLVRCAFRMNAPLDIPLRVEAGQYIAVVHCQPGAPLNLYAYSVDADTVTARCFVDEPALWEMLNDMTASRVIDPLTERDQNVLLHRGADVDPDRPLRLYAAK